MIVTVTPNASLDLTYVLDASDSLANPDIEVHRARSVTLEASGKGVNVTRALTLAGVASTAVYLCGGTTGRHLTELLTADGVPCRPVPVSGATRLNTTVLAPGAPTTKLNAPGSPVSAAEVRALLDAVDDVLARAATDGAAHTWLAVCGSLPPGMESAVVGDLVAIAHERGVRCAVDSSGGALGVALAARADLLAPNLAELAEVSPAAAALRVGDGDRDGGGLDVLGRTLAGVAAEYACELLVSLGARGAVWTDARQVVHAAEPPVVPVNTAGAGDALLAGWLAGGVLATDGPADRLQRAVAWGRAACLSPTTVAAGSH